MTTATALVKPVLLVGPAVRACGCPDCQCPTPANRGTRDNHAFHHHEFANYLREHPRHLDDPSDGGQA